MRNDESHQMSVTSLRLTRRQFLAISAAAATSAVLSACGVAPTAIPATAVPTKAAAVAATVAATVAPAVGKPGGLKIFRMASPRDVAVMDPAQIATITDYQIGEAVFNYIARYTYNPPLGNALTPELAESWEILDGAKTYVFHLRKGVKFHAGYGDLTAEDVKWNWERIKDPKTASRYQTDFAGSTIEVVDPQTLRVRFDKPYPSFIQASLGFRPGFIISPKAMQELGDKWKTRPIGSGPFVWDTYTAGTSLVVKRNADYWGTKPKLDQIFFKLKLDDRAAVLAVAKGELDGCYIADPDVALSVAKAPDPNTVFIKSALGQSPFTLWFNLRRKPFDDLRVRQALRYAIDNNAIAKELFGGLAEPIHSFLPPFMFGYSADVPRYEYNPAKAKQLLKEANVAADWAPSMIGDAGLIINRRIMEAVASYLTDVGVKVKLEMLETGVLTQRNNARDFDMTGTYVARIDPDQIATPYWTSNSSANTSGYTGADELVNKAKAEPDPAQRAKYYRDLQVKLSEDSPAAFVVAVSEHLLLNKRVTGMVGAGWQDRFDWFNLDVPAE